MNFLQRIKELAERGFEISYKIAETNIHDENECIVTAKYNGEAFYHVQTCDIVQTMLNIVSKIENDLKGYEYSLKGTDEVFYVVAENILQAMLIIQETRKIHPTQILGISEVILVPAHQWIGLKNRCPLL